MIRRLHRHQNEDPVVSLVIEECLKAKRDEEERKRREAKKMRTEQVFELLSDSDCDSEVDVDDDDNEYGDDDSRSREAEKSGNRRK